MSRTLGVNCSSKYTFLAVAEGGRVLDGFLERMELPAAEASVRLNKFFDAFGRLLTTVAPIEVALLHPEADPRFKLGYTIVEPRVAMETLVRLATVRADARIGMRVLHRATVRSRLGLPLKGPLVDLVQNVIPEPVGKYWRDARDLASLAALAALIEETT